VTDDELAERHGIKDRAGLAEALFNAGGLYHLTYGPVNVDDDASDTLDKIDKPIAELLDLLADETNRDRLSGALIRLWLEETTPCATVIKGTKEWPEWLKRAGEICDEIDRMVRQLERVRIAARAAHRPGRVGHPMTKGDVTAAYGVLAEFWRRAFGEEKFTRDWDDGKPVTPAARFLTDAIKIIDPDRPGLAAELNQLMKKDIKRFGRGRGRRGTGAK
jgi:hypothetical protein